MFLFSQLRIASVSNWGIVEIAIAIVALAAIVALVWVAMRQFQISIPPWVGQVFWIIVVTFVIILAIKLVAGML